MDQFTVIFPLHPMVVLILMIVGLAGSVYFFQKYQSIQFAKWVAEEGQYHPLPEHVLNEAIDDADDENNKAEFLKYLRSIRVAVGHQNLKIGHLYWIWDQMGKKIRAEDQTMIPTFCEGSETAVPVSGK